MYPNGPSAKSLMAISLLPSLLVTHKLYFLRNLGSICLGVFAAALLEELCGIFPDPPPSYFRSQTGIIILPNHNHVMAPVIPQQPGIVPQ